MPEDGVFCEDCGETVSHDDLETVRDVLQLNPETFEMGPETRDVYVCGGCGAVLGVE
jgi:hypothetical protein